MCGVRFMDELNKSLGVKVLNWVITLSIVFIAYHSLGVFPDV